MSRSCNHGAPLLSRTSTSPFSTDISAKRESAVQGREGGPASSTGARSVATRRMPFTWARKPLDGPTSILTSAPSISRPGRRRTSRSIRASPAHSR